jgi:hypothetical protein
MLVFRKYLFLHFNFFEDKRRPSCFRSVLLGGVRVHIDALKALVAAVPGVESFMAFASGFFGVPLFFLGLGLAEVDSVWMDEAFDFFALCLSGVFFLNNLNLL